MEQSYPRVYATTELGLAPAAHGIRARGTEGLGGSDGGGATGGGGEGEGGGGEGEGGGGEGEVAAAR